MTDRLIITGEEEERIRSSEPRARRNGHPGVADMLRSGAMVFMETQPGGWNVYLKRLGYRMHQRSAVREGVKGFYVWATKVEETV